MSNLPLTCFVEMHLSTYFLDSYETILSLIVFVSRQRNNVGISHTTCYSINTDLCFDH
jgi:hypothetical protein